MFKKIVLLLLIVANGYTFYLTWADKRTAVKNPDRDVSVYRPAEVKLVAASAFGAAPGTLLGFKVFNHKTSDAKTYLREAVKLVLVQNVLLYGVLFIPRSRGNKKDMEIAYDGKRKFWR